MKTTPKTKHQPHLYHLPVFFTLFALLLVSCASIKPDRTYRISQGEEFVIKLKANPSTGYHWEISKGLSDSGLSLLEESYEPAPNPSDKPRLGGGGTKIWRFRAGKKGQTTLTFVYQRSGEKEPEQIKRFRVEVD